MQKNNKQYLGRKFWVVVMVIGALIAIAGMATALVIMGKLESVSWENIITLIISSMISFAGGYMTSNAVSKIKAQK